MIVRTLQSVEEFKALEPAWRRLHDSSPEGSLYTSFDYTWVWWATYPSLGKLCIYVVEDQDQNVLAIAPMYKTQSHLTRFFTLSTLRFIGRGSEVTPVDLNVIFCSDNELANAAGALLLSAWKTEANVQRVLLEELPERSRLFAMLQQQLPHSVEGSQIRWVADLPESWEKFTASLSRNTRKRIKNRRNRLLSENSLTLQLCSDKASMEEALDALVRLHQDRRHSKGDTAAFTTTDYLQFHQTLLAESASQKLMQFVTLKDGDNIIGVEYMYRNKGVLLFNQTGFNPDYEPVSPGHNMMVFAIEQAIEEGLHSIDLLHGNYDYKKSYASESVTTLVVSSYTSPVLRAVARLVQAAKALRF